MADAKKCDICGNYFDKKVNAIDRIGAIRSCRMTINNHWDTCPDCVEALFDFIASRQKIAVKGLCKDCQYENVDEESDPCAYCTSKNSQFAPKEVNKK